MIFRLLVGLLALILGVGGYFAYSIYQYWVQPIEDKPQTVEFEVSKGTGFSKIAHQLQQANVIRKPLYWKLLALYKGQAHRIQSGEYQLTMQSTPEQILQQLVNGEVVRHQLTVVEGVTFKQFWQQIQEQPKLAIQVTDPQMLLERMQPEGGHLEGWFMPDTYTFTKGMTDLDLYLQSYAFMTEYVQKQWSNRAPDLPYDNPYQALIMASIIEKETSVEQERALIAGVFVQRLRKGMKLQTDPTVIYGLGDAYDGNIRRADLRRDTPYNTYVHTGLPPTPICLPGRASIDAALNPDKTEYLFFVSKGDGTHIFSKNYADHSRAVQEYQIKGTP